MINLQQFQMAGMIPQQPQLMLRLIRANTSFLLYGQKASGKTRLIHNLLETANGRFIEINCTLTSKRQSFLWLFNVELKKYLKREGYDIGTSNYLGSQCSLDSWIGDIKKACAEMRQLPELLDNLYVFMDNIEEMAFQESFIPNFYYACQKQFPFRFSFIFCGINFMRKQYTLELPFRTMISFCMPKPKKEFNKIIEDTIKQIYRTHYLDKKIAEQQIQKAANLLGKQVKASFQDIQSNLQKIKNITQLITRATFQIIDSKDLAKSLSGAINRGELRKLVSSVVQHGPMGENQIKNKLHSADGDQQYDVSQNFEFYSNLILTSIHLAEYYPEKQDKRRFQDYKGRSGNRAKDLKRSEFKVSKQNIHRIIAIAQALQSQGKQNDKELSLTHHSLDFYATLQNLKLENRLKFAGNKVAGIVKEEEAKSFMNKNELQYSQFMSN